MNFPRYGWEYPAGCSGPPETPWADRAAEWIQDEDERIVGALTKLYDAESLAYQIVGVWHYLGSMNARGELAQGALDELHEMVERATKAEVKRMEEAGVEARIEHERED